MSNKVAGPLLAAEVIHGDKQDYIDAMTITAENLDKCGRDEVEMMLS